MQAESCGKAGRKVYSLTPAGHERLVHWVREMPAYRKPREEYLLKLFFGGVGGGGLGVGTGEMRCATGMRRSLCITCRWNRLSGNLHEGKPGLLTT